jgi:hypothetical protein
VAAELLGSQLKAEACTGGVFLKQGGHNAKGVKVSARGAEAMGLFKASGVLKDVCHLL